jgi:quinol monooxygenase YgiN
MATQDSCVSVAPYFKIHSGQIASFKAICKRFVEQSAIEANCLYYGFSFNDDIAHCREGFKDAEALLIHIENLKPIVGEMTQVADLIRIEIHGIESELAKLREPLKGMHPDYFVLEFGFRK